MKERLLTTIRESGPMPFEQFMAEALYGEGGFFAGSQLRSVKAGDFLTSPEVSPLFGETIAAFLESEQARAGEPFRLVEVAGGSGSLIAAILSRSDIGDVWAVEASPAARAAVARIIPGERVVEAMEDVPGRFRGVIIANELLDNVPMAIAQMTDTGWRERWVGADGDGLCFVDAPVRPEVRDWLESHAGPVDVGGWVEVQLGAAEWLRAAIDRLVAGSVVLFDYGDTAENLAPRRADGTLRTYRSHHLGPHPLEEPGATDITADVNFSALVAVGEECGATVELFRQDDWLFRWGLRDRISELRHRELELARSGDEMARLAVRTARHEAETLVNPRGLGDFRVLEVRIG